MSEYKTLDQYFNNRENFMLAGGAVRAWLSQFIDETRTFSTPDEAIQILLETEKELAALQEDYKDMKDSLLGREYNLLKKVESLQEEIKQLKKANP